MAKTGKMGSRVVLAKSFAQDTLYMPQHGGQNNSFLKATTTCYYFVVDLLLFNHRLMTSEGYHASPCRTPSHFLMKLKRMSQWPCRTRRSRFRSFGLRKPKKCSYTISSLSKRNSVGMLDGRPPLVCSAHLNSAETL